MFALGLLVSRGGLERRSALEAQSGDATSAIHVVNNSFTEGEVLTLGSSFMPFYHVARCPVSIGKMGELRNVKCDESSRFGGRVETRAKKKVLQSPYGLQLVSNLLLVNGSGISSVLYYNFKLNSDSECVIFLIPSCFLLISILAKKKCRIIFQYFPISVDWKIKG